MKTFGLAILSALLLSGVAFAKQPAIQIDLSVASDGTCQATVDGTPLTVSSDELEVKLPALLPNKKAPIRFGASYETVPDRCFGPMLSALQRLGYASIAFSTEPPPLGPDITHPPAAQ